MISFISIIFSIAAGISLITTITVAKEAKKVYENISKGDKVRKSFGAVTVMITVGMSLLTFFAVILAIIFWKITFII